MNTNIIIAIMNAVNNSLLDLQEFKDSGFYYEDSDIYYEMATRNMVKYLAKELDKKVIDHETAVFLCKYCTKIVID